jgi:undecaprenyl pyrophosphate phosphatase UppP
MREDSSMNSKRLAYEKIPLYLMVVTIALMIIGIVASENFSAIILKPDNIPIAAMLVIIEFFTWVAFKQAAQNDEYTRKGERQKIYEDMIR